MQILKLRKEIDRIDKEILKLIKKRMDISKEVALYKIKNNIKIEDKKREQKIINEKKSLAEEYAINTAAIEKIYMELIEESKRIQEKIITKNEK